MTVSIVPLGLSGRYPAQITLTALMDCRREARAQLDRLTDPIGRAWAGRVVSTLDLAIEGWDETIVEHYKRDLSGHADVEGRPRPIRRYLTPLRPEEDREPTPLERAAGEADTLVAFTLGAACALLAGWLLRIIGG